MTVEKLFEIVDGTKKNEICDDVKLRWVADVEGRVLCEIHGKSPSEVTLPTNGDDVLAIPDPYSGIYMLYLVAMIEFVAGNYLAYSSLSAEFEKSLERYAKAVLRNCARQ